jgi:hypothetical protein
MKCQLLAVAVSTCVLSSLVHAGEEKPLVFEMGARKAAVPSPWKVDPKKREFRLATWFIAGAKDQGDAEVYVVPLPADSGKLLKENIKRWQSIYKLPEGKKDFNDVTTIRHFKVGEVVVTVVAIEGIPVGKTDFRERRINVIFPTTDAAFYLVMRGPAQTVAAHQTAFEKWIKSFR